MRFTPKRKKWRDPLLISKAQAEREDQAYRDFLARHGTTVTKFCFVPKSKQTKNT